MSDEESEKAKEAGGGLPFLIRHRDWTDGATLQLHDYGFFLEKYEPKGYEIVANPPAGYWAGPTEPKVERGAGVKRGKAKSATVDPPVDDVPPVDES